MSETSAILYLTTGQPGCGKTYSRVRWLITRFLPESRGLYITNLPLNVDVIADHVAKITGRDREEFISRIKIIDVDTMRSWRSLTDKASKDLLSQYKRDNYFPPSAYLESFDLQDARICVDEFHRYFNKKSPADLLLLWNDWFAEIRKLGCTFEAVTQELDQLPPEFIGKVGVRVDLLPYSTIRDPYFKIPLSDWYELRAAYAGIREQKVCMVEYRKGTSFTGRVKWVENHKEKFAICEDFFPYYNSYAKTESVGSTAKVSFPADRYGKKTGIWFVKRHFFKLFSKLGILLLFLWLTFGGGLLFIISGFTGMLAKMASANSGRTSSVSASAVPASEVGSGQGGTPSAAPSAVPVGVPSPGADSAGVPVVPDVSVFKPVMFFDGKVFLKNGIVISMGYQFKGGVYDGKIVEKIDFANRTYTLSDDVTVYMY